MAHIQQYFPFAIAALAFLGSLAVGLGIREQLRNLRISRSSRGMTAY
jgi:hypothetical protein